MKINKPKSKFQKEHDKVLERLQKNLKNFFKLEKFNEKEAMITIKEKWPRKPHYYVAHKPDCIINIDGKPENRIIIEYVHKPKTFLFDLRGMLALSTKINVRKFILVVSEDVFQQYKIVGIHGQGKVLMMSINSLLNGLKKIGASYLTTL